MCYVDRIAVAFKGGRRLDCCNGRLCGVADSQLRCLQLVQNAWFALAASTPTHRIQLYKLPVLHGRPIALCSVSCRWLTTRYWRPSWTTIAISASITRPKLATPRTVTDKNDVWWPSVRSSRSTGKNVFQMVEKTELWTSAVYRWRRSCQAVVVNPTFMLASDSQSILHANIFQTHASDADKPNEWLLIVLLRSCTLSILTVDHEPT